TSSAKCHPELVSGSHCEPLLTPDCGQMLKQVQHDHLLEVFAFCYIEVQKKLKTHYSQPKGVCHHHVILKFAIKREQSQACLAMPSVSKLNKS
ncbi:MAG: hypothetical protein J6L60_05030, partial [Bacteroidaceae bacterium]|nr:hypothetical protein [Bacteroidaceae bacterium]